MPVDQNTGEDPRFEKLSEIITGIANKMFSKSPGELLPEETKALFGILEQNKDAISAQLREGLVGDSALGPQVFGAAKGLANKVGDAVGLK